MLCNVVAKVQFKPSLESPSSLAYPFCLSLTSSQGDWGKLPRLLYSSGGFSFLEVASAVLHGRLVREISCQ